jgi:hypothetical protein
MIWIRHNLLRSSRQARASRDSQRAEVRHAEVASEKSCRRIGRGARRHNSAQVLAMMWRKMVPWICLYPDGRAGSEGWPHNALRHRLPKMWPATFRMREHRIRPPRRTLRAAVRHADGLPMGASGPLEARPVPGCRTLFTAWERLSPSTRERVPGGGIHRSPLFPRTACVTSPTCPVHDPPPSDRVSEGRQEGHPASCSTAGRMALAG